MSRELVEAGDVFFCYRPRVGLEEVHDLDDVQRFFAVVRPDGGQRYRELVIGAKRLPDTARHERAWAFVAEVTEDPAELRHHLERKEYQTKTRGTRVQPEAPPAGEGRYAIVPHDRHTHLAYWLEEPRDPGPTQELFNVERAASYIVAVKNPEAPTPPGVGLPGDRRADFPPELLKRFGGRRYAPLDTPELLDYKGAELVLIGATTDVSRELGIDLDLDDERVESADLLAKGALH
jgi:hypothetical protein